MQKKGKIVSNLIEADELQSNLNVFNGWNKTWLMEFN